ncbi:hypothetical protein [Pandoraea terrae]|uniref:hypothetical protein n=1 Tax=Pandoraea terrae TaxID=1537710 RepID=UPI001784FA29|nr:hypothetical protein [Pandoraea terrae]
MITTSEIKKSVCVERAVRTPHKAIKSENGCIEHLSSRAVVGCEFGRPVVVTIRAC